MKKIDFTAMMEMCMQGCCMCMDICSFVFGMFSISKAKYSAA